jgi:ribosomal protein L11 methyltransferase
VGAAGTAGKPGGGHPLSYLALRFDVGAAEADAWGDALLGAGALSVDAADAAAGTGEEKPLFAEPGEQRAHWATSRLTALLDGSADASDVLATAARAIGQPLPVHETFAVADADWVRATQAQFSPLEIAPRIWIVPSWCEPVEPDAINIALDPGLAFGTGSHPTTRLCARWLAGALRGGESVLDYGCGSGILAIVAAKLGARRVVGTDIDPQAIAASRDNARRNRVAVRLEHPDAPLVRTSEPFDVVIANILANPLRMLAPALAMRAARRIVLSGILTAQADELIAVYSPWFNMRVWSDDEGWVALEGVRHDARPA